MIWTYRSERKYEMFTEVWWQDLLYDSKLTEMGLGGRLGLREMDYKDVLWIKLHSSAVGTESLFLITRQLILHTSF